MLLLFPIFIIATIVLTIVGTKKFLRSKSADCETKWGKFLNFSYFSLDKVLRVVYLFLAILAAFFSILLLIAMVSGGGMPLGGGLGALNGAGATAVDAAAAADGAGVVVTGGGSNIFIRIIGGIIAGVVVFIILEVVLRLVFEYLLMWVRQANDVHAIREHVNVLPGLLGHEGTIGSDDSIADLFRKGPSPEATGQEPASIAAAPVSATSQTQSFEPVANTWNCQRCGKTENKGAFCPKCGQPR